MRFIAIDHFNRTINRDFKKLIIKQHHLISSRMQHPNIRTARSVTAKIQQTATVHGHDASGARFQRFCDDAGCTCISARVH